MDTQGAAQTSTRTSIQAVLAIVGSVCGTLLSGALTTSPTLKLVGAAFGAAIPPLISQAGRFHQVRAGVGIAVTVGALFLTCGGICIEVTATSLSCTGDGCDPLTIKSTGSKPLLVRSIESTARRRPTSITAASARTRSCRPMMNASS